MAGGDADKPAKDKNKVTKMKTKREGVGGGGGEKESKLFQVSDCDRAFVEAFVVFPCCES